MNPSSCRWSPEFRSKSNRHSESFAVSSLCGWNTTVSTSQRTCKQSCPTAIGVSIISCRIRLLQKKTLSPVVNKPQPPLTGHKSHETFGMTRHKTNETGIPKKKIEIGGRLVGAEQSKRSVSILSISKEACRFPPRQKVCAGACYFATTTNEMDTKFFSAADKFTC